MGALEKMLARIPVTLIALAYSVYLGGAFYFWMNDATSDLGMKKANVVALKQQLQADKDRINKAEDFVRNLDVIRSRIINLTNQLNGLKTTLSSEVDIGDFMRKIHLEAKRVGVHPQNMKPLDEVAKEHYIEVPFSFELRGAYVQLLVFFDRLTKIQQQVIRVADFEMKPLGSNQSKYVELDAKVKLLTYRYLGSKADDVLKEPEMKASEGAVSGGAK